MNAGFGPNPVRYVSFFDTMRFVNWLENGQTRGAGTESGVYTIADGVERSTRWRRNVFHSQPR